MTSASRSQRRRTTIAMTVVLVIVAVFALRLVDVQVVKASSLDAQSKSELSVTEPIYADRGDITASDGTVLASTVLRYNVTAAPDVANTFTRTSHHTTVKVTVRGAMQEISSITGTSVTALMSAITANKKSQFAYLVKSVDVGEYQAIVALQIPYVYLQRESARSYPDGAVAGNLLGFTGDSGAQAGLELQQNACLAGSDGSETYERGADGVVLPGSTVVTQKATQGGTVKTTLNADLQYQVQQILAQQTKALGATSATAVVMKVSDASLLAVADYPSVDPNNINATPSADLYSQAFTNLFEPGSIMKSLTAASLIDQGKVTPATEVSVPDSRSFPWGGVIDDAESHPVEPYTLTGILANSSNVGISMLGTRLSAQERYDYLVKFGLGSRSGVDFPGEPTAPLRPVSQWDQQTNYNEMFGQGVSATSIQMADAYEAIANGGVRVPAKLVESCTSSTGKVTTPTAAAPTRVVSASTANQVVDMLEQTIPKGTLSTMTPIPGYTIAAKTGTAQIADAPGGGYGDDFITSVAAIAPAANPQYVVLVTFNKPTTNKTSAGVGPAFRAIMTDVLQDYRVTPNDQAANLPTTW